MDGRPVHEREEYERVVGAVLPLEMLDQSRRRWPEAAHPLQFLGAGARRAKNAVGELPETVLVVWLVDGEAPHEHAADAIRPLAVFVLPRPRIASRGRQHVDVVAQAQLLGNQAARVLGACRDFAAIPWRDERELHAIAPRACASTTGPDGSSSSTCAAGRRECRRRASQPGSVSMACAGGLDESHANMSRYFRSITGQL